MVDSESVQPLDNQVRERARAISTQSYGMSVGELVSLYQEKELIIRPQFQRFFRWSLEQKTRLIESILLGIPLPHIFVNALEDGKWEVIDGMQRLSTIIEFMGKLAGDAQNLVRPEFKIDKDGLESAEYLPDLKGKRWTDISPASQRKFRRARIDVAIITDNSSTDVAKYDLFDRLNTGSPTNEQEVRNCILIMQDTANKSDFYSQLEGLVKHDSFKESVAVSERLVQEQYPMELLCRFLVFAFAENLQAIGPLGRFITREMIDLQKNQKSLFAERGQKFCDTFDCLRASGLGENVFKRYDPERENFKGAFILSPYEAIACGVARNLSSIKNGEFVQKKIKEMWGSKDFLDIMSRKGMTASTRIPLTVDFGRKWFRQP